MAASKPTEAKRGRKRPTEPSVFIVESVDFADEAERRVEGSILSDLLRLSGKDSTYRYLRTRQELAEILQQFGESNMRYLHISCHGDDGALWTTLDRIPFDELAEMMAPYLANRRLFISACDATNKHLAQQVMRKVACRSIIGPAGEISFADAAVMWAAFYHLVFTMSPTGMNAENIRSVLSTVATTFQVPFKYFARASEPPYFTQRTFSGKKLG